MIHPPDNHSPTQQNTITIAVLPTTSALYPPRHILLLQRNPCAYSNYNDPYPFYWELVGGHVEDGEPPEEAARRELLEETGLTGIAMELVGVVPHRGGTATNWVYLAMVGHTLPIVLSQEHLSAKWEILAEARRIQLAYKHTPIMEAIGQRYGWW